MLGNPGGMSDSGSRAAMRLALSSALVAVRPLWNQIARSLSPVRPGMFRLAAPGRKTWRGIIDFNLHPSYAVQARGVLRHPKAAPFTRHGKGTQSLSPSVRPVEEMDAPGLDARDMDTVPWNEQRTEPAQPWEAPLEAPQQREPVLPLQVRRAAPAQRTLVSRTSAPGAASYQLGEYSADEETAGPAAAAHHFDMQIAGVRVFAQRVIEQQNFARHTTAWQITASPAGAVGRSFIRNVEGRGTLRVQSVPGLALTPAQQPPFSTTAGGEHWLNIEGVRPSRMARTMQDQQADGRPIRSANRWEEGPGSLSLVLYRSAAGRLAEFAAQPNQIPFSEKRAVLGRDAIPYRQIVASQYPGRQEYPPYPNPTLFSEPTLAKNIHPVFSVVAAGTGLVQPDYGMPELHQRVFSARPVYPTQPGIQSQPGRHDQVPIPPRRALKPPADWTGVVERYTPAVMLSRSVTPATGQAPLLARRPVSSLERGETEHRASEEQEAAPPPGVVLRQLPGGSAAAEWPLLSLLEKITAQPSRSDEPAGVQILRRMWRSKQSEVISALIGLAGLGPGEPLPARTRRPLQNWFGRDLGEVRLHSSPLVNTLRAEALTSGRRIVFAPGRLDQNTPQGMALLGHELAHVVSGAGQALYFKQERGLEPGGEDEEENSARRQEAAVQHIIERGWPVSSSPAVVFRRARPVDVLTAGPGAAVQRQAIGIGEGPEDLETEAVSGQAEGQDNLAAETPGRNPPAAQAQRAAAGSAAAPGGDIESLARQVYGILKKRLRAEHDRHQLYGI